MVHRHLSSWKTRQFYIEQWWFINFTCPAFRPACFSTICPSPWPTVKLFSIHSALFPSSLLSLPFPVPSPGPKHCLPLAFFYNHHSTLILAQPSASSSLPSTALSKMLLLASHSPLWVTACLQSLSPRPCYLLVHGNGQPSWRWFRSDWISLL